MSPTTRPAEFPEFSDTYTLPPITGAEFVAALRAGEDVGNRFSNRTITGRVDLTGVNCPFRVRVRSARFVEPVVGADARFDNTVDFTGCRFEQGIMLDRARIGGALILKKSQFQPLPIKANSGDYDYISLWHTRIGRWLDLEGIQTKAADGKSSRVYGMEAQIKGRVILVATTVRGDVWFNFATVRHSVFAGTGVSLDRAAYVTGQFRLHRSNVGSVLLAGVTVGGELDLSGATVRGGVQTMYRRLSGRSRNPEPRHQAGRAQPRSAASPDPLPATFGSVLLSQACVTGYVNLSGATIGGDLDLEASRVAGSVIVQMPADNATPTRVSGDLMFSAATVGVNVEIQGLQVDGKLDMRNARIRGDVLAKRHLPGVGEPGPATTIGGGTELDGVTVGGATSFEGADCRGPFRAVYATFDDGLRCDGMTHAGGPVRLPNCERQDFDLSYTRVNASLSLDGATLRENVQIHGVRVKGNVTAAKAVFDRNLSAVRATVVGSVNLAGAQVAGCLTLANSDVGANLVLDGGGTASHVRNEPGVRSPVGNPDLAFDEEVAVNLEFARVRGMCRLLHPDAIREESRVAIGHAQFGSLSIAGAGFPPMSANGFGFRQLELAPVEEERLVLELLDRTHTFQRSTYRTIERYYRDRGADRIADRIFRQMRREEEIEARTANRSARRVVRATQSVWGAVVWLWQRVCQDLLVGYGTASHRVFFLLVLIFASMTWMFSDARSAARSFTPTALEMKTAPMAADEDHHPPRVWADTRTWRGSDAIAMAVRTTVPLVPLIADKDWSPSSKPVVDSGPQWLKEWISFQNVAGVTQFLCYLLVPLFLASASGWLKRRGE